MSKMASFEHKNVMTLIGVCLDGEMPLIIMPFMGKGNVLEYVRKMNENQLQETTMKTNFLGICHQITKGMRYLADCKFVHRDLAARNCMIDEKNMIKVADFGLSENVYSSGGYVCQSNEEAVAREEKVPIRWMAPESIESGRYSEKTDVWAFGVTCWEIFTFGHVPYSGIRAMSILNVLKSGQRLERPINDICSDNIYDVMTVCWSEISGDRPNFESLVHTFDDILERESGYIDLCS
ncbi:Tyrosine-protein kinase transforming protein SEA [Geodia barretti]|uniref:Tyrosine-protein kinase transforming protein SEA n=3 Tax=Geodia barretti TaxID=519541 RepID=A0AA35U288_GEOBA|nr:Tyrosine-protein kinase transforming protein SEA [Geodia barretti]